jgi:hypothetical protein
MKDILTGASWDLNVALICVSFMGRDVEHFFMCVLTIWISSIEKALLSSFANFFMG